MTEMQEDDEENYAKHFAKYIEDDKEADDLEDMYTEVHASIRKDPSRKAKTPFTKVDKSFKKGIKKTYEARKADSNAKKASIRSAGDEDDE